MSKTKTSNSNQNYFKKYALDQTWKKNKQAKLAKHKKNHPNDIQAQNVSDFSYGRKTPTKSMWTPTGIETAWLIKHFCGKCPSAVFTIETSAEAKELFRSFAPEKIKKQHPKVSSKLGDRARLC